MELDVFRSGKVLLIFFRHWRMCLRKIRAGDDARWRFCTLSAPSRRISPIERGDWISSHETGRDKGVGEKERGIRLMLCMDVDQIEPEGGRKAVAHFAQERFALFFTLLFALKTARYFALYIFFLWVVLARLFQRHTRNSRFVQKKTQMNNWGTGSWSRQKVGQYRTSALCSGWLLPGRHISTEAPPPPHKSTKVPHPLPLYVRILPPNPPFSQIEKHFSPGKNCRGSCFFMLLPLPSLG